MTILSEYALSSTNDQSFKELITSKEREVLSLVAGGYDNHAIARRLSVSEPNVNRRLTSLFWKTGVKDRLELVLFAIHHHLVPLGEEIGDRSDLESITMH
jgi:DNA-binding NarL/FixJ family response regulator